MASYAAVADFLDRYDVRVLGDLVGDEERRLTPGELETNAKITAALVDAAGMIEAACLQGKRYTAAQLAALTGNSLGYLKRLNCQIAFGLLWEQRPAIADDRRDAAMNQMQAVLKQLRTGEIIFNVTDVPEAGLPSILRPTSAQLGTLNLVVDEARRGYYPARRLAGE